MNVQADVRGRGTEKKKERKIYAGSEKSLPTLNRTTVQRIYHVAKIMYLRGAANCGQKFKIYLGLRIGCGLVTIFLFLRDF